MNTDIRNLSKWLNEEQEAPIDRQALARVLAMAAPVQEPVAWRYTDARGHYRYRGFVANFDKEYRMLKPQALYTSPPAQRTWVGLTDEEEVELWESTDSDWELMKRTEAKLKEKNT